MGLYQSKAINEWDAQQVAAALSSLGQQYAAYAPAVRENGVDGPFLSSLSRSEITETLDDLGITNRLHRRVIEKKALVLLFPSADRINTTILVDMTLASCTSLPTNIPHAHNQDADPADKETIWAILAAAAERQKTEYNALLSRQASLQSQVGYLQASRVR